ncbi:hypothetical protein AgCh_009307 [Apium graveolens]
MDDQVKEQFRAIDKCFDEKSKRYEGKFDEIILMMREMKELTENCSTEVPRDQLMALRLMEEKVDLVSLYMSDKAEVWVSNYLSLRRNVDWSEFVIDLSASQTTQSGGVRPVNKPFQFIPTEVRAEKLAKGLCYYYDQKYGRGHKYHFKKSQLFTVEISSCDGREHFDDDNGDDGEENTINLQDHCISVNALSDIPGQEVTVADGNHLVCKNIVKDLVWKVGGNTFTTDVMLIDLVKNQKVKLKAIAPQKMKVLKEGRRARADIVRGRAREQKVSAPALMKLAAALGRDRRNPDSCAI